MCEKLIYRAEIEIQRSQNFRNVKRKETDKRVQAWGRVKGRKNWLMKLFERKRTVRNKRQKMEVSNKIKLKYVTLTFKETSD